jgi:hypothetical protein
MCIAPILSYLLLTAAAAVGNGAVSDVSHTRVAYVVGRPFINDHDRYGGCTASATIADAPSVYGHEPISVGLGCADSVRVSAVMAAIAWIAAHGETDATVVMSREHRGNTAVEAALQALREKGVTVPQHRSVPQPNRPSTFFHACAMLAGASFAALLLAVLRGFRGDKAERQPSFMRKRSRSAPVIIDLEPIARAPPSRHSFSTQPHKPSRLNTAYHHVGVHPMVPRGHADRHHSRAVFQQTPSSPRVPCA